MDANSDFTAPVYTFSAADVGLKYQTRCVAIHPAKVFDGIVAFIVVVKVL
jgi:hypothetical protein